MKRKHSGRRKMKTVDVGGKLPWNCGCAMADNAVDNILLFREVLVMSLSIFKRQFC